MLGLHTPVRTSRKEPFHSRGEIRKLCGTARCPHTLCFLSSLDRKHKGFCSHRLEPLENDSSCTIPAKTLVFSEDILKRPSCLTPASETVGGDQHLKSMLNTYSACSLLSTRNGRNALRHPSQQPLNLTPHCLRTTQSRIVLGFDDRRTRYRWAVFKTRGKLLTSDGRLMRAPLKPNA